MGDFRVTGATRIFFLVFFLMCMFRAVISTGLGSCPIYPQLPNFDIRKMAGTWYEVERSFYLMEVASSCTELEVSLNERDFLLINVKTVNRWYKLEVERSFYLMEVASSCTELEVSLNERDFLLITVKTVNRWTGSPSTTYGLGIPSYNGSSAFRYKQNNRMPYIIGRLLPGAGQYNILLTDYDLFAIVWSCTNLSIAHSDRMWVLGRARELEAAARAHIYGALQRLRLDPDRLVLAKQDNCTRPPDTRDIN